MPVLMNLARTRAPVSARVIASLAEFGLTPDSPGVIAPAPPSMEAHADRLLGSLGNGGILFITGPSGSGKSTLLRSLARSARRQRQHIIDTHECLARASDTPGGPIANLFRIRIDGPCGVLSLLAVSVNCLAVDFTFGWKPSPNTNVIGYDVYYGVVSRSYTNVITTGATNRVIIPNLVPGETYFFAVTAYNIVGLESLFSPETSYTIPIPPPILQISPFNPGNLTVRGQVGASYQLQYSTNLAPNLIWRTLTSFTQTNSEQSLTIDAHSACAFFRLVRGNVPP